MKPMKIKIPNDQKGIALVSTLLLMALCMVIVVTLMYMVTAGTKVVGIEQHYTTALEAGKGGAALIENMINNNSATVPTFAGSGVTFTASSSTACITQKLGTPLTGTVTNVSGVWGSCNATGAVTSDPTSNPDVTMVANNYTVFIKITDVRQDATSGKNIYTIVIRATEPDSTNNEHVDISLAYMK